MAWQKGPLRPNTWNWGGVVATDEADPVVGFHFADFCGDHVVTEAGRTLKPHEVAWYNNAIDQPPTGKGRPRGTPP
jgi:hypothetical protein